MLPDDIGALARKGARNMAMALPHSAVVESLVAMPKLRRWMHERASGAAITKERPTFWREVKRQLTGLPILYLEFGVWQGESSRHWLALDPSDQSRFIGFDTFEGLHEPFEHILHTMPIGTFATGGETPRIDDPRQSFRKGLFQDTVPGLLDELPALLSDRQLVVHLDADLYSSTLYVLVQLHPYLRGAVVMFDEFSSVRHEFRALEDYCAAFRADYQVLAVTHKLDQVAIRF